MYELIINDPGTRANPNNNFKADFLTAILAFDVWPGKTTYADTPLDPISTFACNEYRGPQVFSVSRVHMPASTPLAQRTLQIRGIDFTSVGTGAPTVTLGGTSLTVLSFDDTTINARIPTGLMAGQRQLRVTAPNGVQSVNGLTFHLTGLLYNPTIRTVGGPAGSPNPAATIQAAINASSRAATANTLIDVFPGVYRENVLWMPLMLQGHGPGGLVGVNREPLAAARRPALQRPGQHVDGRFFRDNFPGTTPANSSAARLDASRPFAGYQDPPGGADITVIARSTAFGDGVAAAIDGFGIVLGQGGGAGGIHVNGFGRRLHIRTTSSRATAASSAARSGSACRFLRPENNENDDVSIRYNRVLGSGGRFRRRDRHLQRRGQLRHPLQPPLREHVGQSTAAGSPTRPQPRREHPRQQDLLQRRLRLGRRDHVAGDRTGGLGRPRPSTSTAT